MAMDNPSYFVMPEEASMVNNGFNPFRTIASSRGPSEDCVDSAIQLSARHIRAQHTGHSISVNGTTNFVGDHNAHQHKRTQSNESKRNFRSLLRSMSANAACSKKNQGILQGLPRPADIAPPGQVPTFRCSTGKINDPSNRRNRSTAFQNIHDGKLTNPTRNNSEDVFYTIPLPGNTKRRHSIGTYLDGDTMASKCVLKITSVPSEVPTMDPPVFFQDNIAKARTVTMEATPRTLQTVTTLLRQEPSLPVSKPAPHTPANTGRRKKSRRISNKEMEDIVIIYSVRSAEGQLWYNYLSSCFDKMMSERARHHYRVLPWTIEEIDSDDEASNKTKGILLNAKLQIIILCPILIESINKLKDSPILKNILKTERVLTMLLGVTHEMLEKEWEDSSIRHQEWQKMEINEQNTTVVENFLSVAVSILSRKKIVKTNSIDKAGFSIVPKKIKMGQNRVIALLNDPIGNDDNIKVCVDKKGEILQITSFKKRNPYTLQFDIPDCCLEVSMLIWIKIEKNGTSLGSRQIKCESRLRELDQILRASDNPMEFMCQTLGFKTTDRDQLDSWMLSSFQKNIPPHYNLLCISQTNGKPNSPSMDEYPTLLHFAARFGLEKLCWQLLECPGGDAASDIRNVRHLTPADLAHSAGFAELAVVLRGYMQMNEFSNMYYYLKNMSEDAPKTKEPSNQTTEDVVTPTKDDILKNIHELCEEENTQAFDLTQIPEYKNTDPFSDICLQNLEPQKNTTLNVVLPMNEQLYENDMVINNVNKACDDVIIQKALENDYLIQPSNIKVEPTKSVITIPNPYTFTPINTSHQPVFIYSPTEENKPFVANDISTNQTPKSKISHSLKLGNSNPSATGQDELAEIINDFKNNVFTINEVEKLVMDWRNRNETTQSLTEKQEQLDKMRKEYERLQKKMKEELKRPTPFERVKKLFSKGKPKDTNKSGILEPNLSTSTLRPMSRLSVQSESSSSSGRLSTVSGASIGENAMHSDADDKKVIDRVASSTPLAEIKTPYLNDDYLIPPPPRPLISDASLQDFTSSLNRTVIMESTKENQYQRNLEQQGLNLSEGGTVDEEHKNKHTHLYMNITPT